MQINRLFGIVYILLNKQRVTAGELAEHFEVSQRTIYRDVDALCEAGIPIYTNKGKGGGISLLEGFVLNKLVLSEQDRNEIMAALQGLHATNYPGADAVLGKLGELFGGETANWIEVDFSDWSNMQQDKFLIVKQAITGKHLLTFNYYSSYGQKTGRAVEPLQLWFKGRTWYLRGYCRQKQDIRVFKLTRMRDVLMHDETFERQYEALKIPQKTSHQAMPIVDLKLKFDASQGYRIYDEFDETQVTMLEGGSFIVHVSFPEDEWVYGYILSFGDSVEILEPEHIKNIIKDRIKKILDKYS